MSKDGASIPSEKTMAMPLQELRRLAYTTEFGGPDNPGWRVAVETDGDFDEVVVVPKCFGAWHHDDKDPEIHGCCPPLVLETNDNGYLAAFLVRILNGEG